MLTVRHATIQSNVVLKAALLGLGAISVWRGVWNWMDLYLVPSMPFLSNLLSVLLGFVFFFICGEIRL